MTSKTSRMMDSYVFANKSFPGLYAYPAFVSDGENGYIIGGFGSLPENDGSYFPTNGIVR
jgi:hypothetical protein